MLDDGEVDEDVLESTLLDRIAEADTLELLGV
jgi:hypothetical protein